MRGNLRLSKAHWVSTDTIAWNPSALEAGAQVRLHFDADAGLSLDATGVVGVDSIPLVEDPAGLSEETKALFPHLQNFKAFKLQNIESNLIRQILKGQLAVSASDSEGEPIDATGVQIPGVLDELFFYGGELGPVFVNEGLALKVWAPTAQSVQLHLFDDSSASSPSLAVPMTEDPQTGVWRADGPLEWNRKFYLYQVQVYSPSTGRIETNLVTDPYSFSLAADSKRSQIVNLLDGDLKPEGWESLQKPPLSAPEDIAIYELHVRDFSIADGSVPEGDRGKFTAFGHTDSTGMQHLSRLARSGLTHVHLLPSFDFATVPEKEEDQLEPAGDLASYPPDSGQQQAAIAAVKDQDGFNWGYDPFHFTVPEGSYSTDPDGTARILEFREMVQSLNQAGLRVVMDVVYNHTTAAGQNEKAVLDKIVPGYYHRLSLEGVVETSSCCPNTATEHKMMEKLMIDSVLTWVRLYQVDGFRFDLMGHHMKSNMVKLRQALDSLTLQGDGVDGAAIYVYGEGWNFGEVADNARGVNATQRNMAGTGIGTFNDRLRDGVRGGNPFSNVRDQGFVNGLFYDSNGTPQGDEKGTLLHISDWIRIGLAGMLADYRLVDSGGNLVRADEVDYFGQRAGYTADPQEDINYSESHDNETLFDAIQLKASDQATLAERVRMHKLGISLVSLGQGVPFFQAGHEMLRSKSMDRDSFNSGDWFNQLDYTFQTNNWGKGLPSAEKNQDNWPIMQPLLADPALKPAPSDLEGTVGHFEEMLRIRNSSPLFRLRRAEQVHSSLHFQNTGPDQIPGLIVMILSDLEGEIDRRTQQIVTLFNARKEAVTFPLSTWNGEPYALHSIQMNSSDPVVKTSGFESDSGEFFVPAQTAAVFLSARPAGQRIDLLMADVQALVHQGQLNQGQGNSLVSKLQNVLHQFNAGKNRPAAEMLQAFLNEVEGLARSGILDQSTAGVLRREAEEILALILSNE